MLPKSIYESLPYFCIVVALIGMVVTGFVPLATICGTLLIGISLYILKLRISFRRAAAQGKRATSAARRAAGPRAARTAKRHTPRVSDLEARGPTSHA